MAIQAQNIAYERVVVGGVTGMRPVEGAIAWLPQGFVTPLEQENPFRWMLRLLPAWLAVCALSMGLRGRGGALLTLNLLGGTLVLWTLVAFIQFLGEVPRMLWIWEVRQRAAGQFWGTFVNPNHGALMLILGQSILLGLFLRGAHRQFIAHFRIMGPHVLYLALALGMAAGVFPSGSRGALLATGLLWLAFFGLGTLQYWCLVGARALIIPAVSAALLAGSFAAVLNNPNVWPRFQRALDKFDRVATNLDGEARSWVNRIGVEMIRDKPVFGHGAGGWRYFYLPYERYFPQFDSARVVFARDAGGNLIRDERGRAIRTHTQLWFRQAHNDWLELVVELGWLGAAPIFLGLLIWGGLLFFHGLRDPTLFMFAAGPAALLLSAIWEFHLRLPAPLLWTAVVMALILLLGASGRKAVRPPLPRPHQPSHP